MRQHHYNKEWEFKTPDLDKSLKLAAELGVSLLAGQLLVSRNVTDPKDAITYLYPEFADGKGFHDPFKLSGMDKAVERIQKAKSRGEKICIYGDYDTDGTTATALLLDAFREMDIPADYYIPNRFSEGYGLTESAVKEIYEKNNTKLLITVDCGITSVKEIELANQLGMDVIVTDHHQPHPVNQPPAHVLISPKIPENEYPYPDLAGVGLAFKLAHGLYSNQEFIKSLLDLVVLGTVVDLVPLTGENRALSRVGLEVLNAEKDPGVYMRSRIGIRALCKVAGYEAKRLVGQSLSFGLGPRINAAGRVDTARKVVELLTTDSEPLAARIASELDQMNQKRQELERQIRDHALEIIEDKIDPNKKSIVVYSDEWDPKAKGVVGIVASRLVEIHHKPVFVLAIDGEEATGSGRCIEGMNLADSLVANTKLLVKHGGHAAAAGLTIKTKNLRKFEEDFEKYACEHLTEDALQPKLKLDFETCFPVLTLQTLEELEQFEPFGRENDPPRFYTHRVKIRGVPRLLGKEKQHLSMNVSQSGDNKRAIAWGKGDKLISFRHPNMLLDIAFSPQINEWRDQRSVQVILKDWRIHSEGRKMKWDMFPKRDDKSSVKLIDERGTNKGKYLLSLLAKEEPCIIYVQDEKMLDILLTKLLPESTEGIARHDETVGKTEEVELLNQLGNGELRAIASSDTFSHLEGIPFVKHFVFCHLTPSFDELLKRCCPAFASPETSYLHLIYGDTDIGQIQNWIAQRYPTQGELRQLYIEIRDLIQSKGVAGCPKTEILNSKLDAMLTVQTALTIFEELRFIERHGQPEHLKLLSVEKNGLSSSPTYLKGEWIKQTSPSFLEFQLNENIEFMWKRLESMWECMKNESQIANKPDSSI